MDGWRLPVSSRIRRRGKGWVVIKQQHQQQRRGGANNINKISDRATRAVYLVRETGIVELNDETRAINQMSVKNSIKVNLFLFNQNILSFHSAWVINWPLLNDCFLFLQHNISPRWHAKAASSRSRRSARHFCILI